MGFFYFIGSCGAESWDYTGLNTGLLEMIGRGYVIDYCVSLFNSRIRERLYREYVTSTLKVLNDNFAKQFGGNVMSMNYADLFESRDQDTRTGDEIVRDIMKRANLKVKGQSDERI